MRTETLDWTDEAYDSVMHEIAAWLARDIRLAGIQVDFDAATRGLARYADFLAGFRRRIPDGLSLSVTGLMDWSAGGDPAALARLADIVDEVVIQTYQGRHTIPGYEAYFRSLSRLRIPYRVGLVEGGEWREPERLADDPQIRGYVVFLLGRRPA